jgi:MFS family permease
VWGIAIAGAIALAAAIGVGRFAFTPLLPMMQHDAGLSITAGGWLASVNYLGYFAGAIVAVSLRVPAHSMLRAAMVFNALLVAGMGVTDTLAVWLAIRFAAGIASAWVFVFASTLVLARLAAHRRIELSGVMFAGVGTGMFLSGLLCMVLVIGGVAAQFAWLAFAGLAAIAAVLIWPVFNGTPESSRADTSGAPRRHRWTATTVRLVVSYGLFGFGYIIPATFLPTFARDMLAGSQFYVWYWPACGIAAALSAVISIPLSRRFGDYRLLVACCVVEAAGIALPVIAPTAAGIGISALLLGGTFVVITVAALREARELAPAHAATLIAAMTSSFALGQIAGPLIAAHLVAWCGDFNLPLMVGAAALLVSAALVPRPAPTR